jgi:hypothetical protein
VVTDTEYAADVTLTALLPEGTEAAFSARLQDISAGTVALEVTGEALRSVPIKERS